MADEAVARSQESEVGEVEVKDRGFFNFGGKKKEEDKDEEREQVLATKLGKVHFEDVEEPVEEAEVEKKHTLRDKLHGSGSSSSSDEEEGEGENKEKKKKKKGLKERINEKMHGDGEEVEVSEVDVEEKENCLKELKEKVDVVPPAVVGQHEDTEVVVEKVEETEKVEQVAPEDEKKGFLEKIKEKLPGHHKKTSDEVAAATPLPPSPGAAPAAEHEGEKKGFLEKIKEKLPGYHSNKNGVEETEKNT